MLVEDGEKSLICSFCYNFSFLEGSVVDHRDVKLQSVKLRYAEEKFYKVSEIQVRLDYHVLVYNVLRVTQNKYRYVLQD